MGTRLFIGNLSYNVNEQELREAFSSEGIEVRSVRVALDRDTGRPRGFAFVETATDEGAKASIEKLSGRLMQGRAIIIEEAQAKPTAPRPGGPPGPAAPGVPGAPRPGAAEWVRPTARARAHRLPVRFRAARRVPAAAGGSGRAAHRARDRRPAWRWRVWAAPRPRIRWCRRWQLQSPISGWRPAPERRRCAPAGATGEKEVDPSQAGGA